MIVRQLAEDETRCIVRPAALIHLGRKCSCSQAPRSSKTGY